MSFESFLIVAAILFCIGLYGALARRNVLAVLMSIELMFNAVNITLVAMANTWLQQAFKTTSALCLPGKYLRCLSLRWLLPRLLWDWG